MPAATVEKPNEPEQLVSQPEGGTLYMSRRSELRLLRTNTRNRFDQEGHKIETMQGESVTFKDGVLRLPTSKRMTIDKGMKVPTEEIREWLEDHRSFGDREEGFWRVDPVAPPVGEDELERLTELTTDLDMDRLALFIEQEEAGWGREKLLVAARKAYGRVEEAMTRLKAEQRDALAKARSEGRSEALEMASQAKGAPRTAKDMAQGAKDAEGVEGAK